MRATTPQLSRCVPIIFYIVSHIFRVVFLELLYDLVVVVLDTLHVPANAMYCLLHVVIGIEDAVLEAEACGIAVVSERCIEFPEDLLPLSLLADQDLLEVGR